MTAGYRHKNRTWLAAQILTSIRELAWRQDHVLNTSQRWLGADRTGACTETDEEASQYSVLINSVGVEIFSSIQNTLGRLELVSTVSIYSLNCLTLCDEDLRSLFRKGLESPVFVATSRTLAQKPFISESLS